MRRVALAALLLAALGLACTRPHARPPEPVVFWQPWPPSVVAPAVARFEADNPSLHVSVRQVPLSAVDDSLAAALAAGTPPDLCVIGSSDMPHWLASNVLSDWSAGVADLRDSLRGWPPCTVGDALYGLPWLLDVRALYCNPALFARAGLDASHPPETWAQLRSAAARIQKLGHGVHGFGLARGDTLESAAELLAFAWGNGGEVLSAGLDSSRLDSRPVLEAVELLASVRHSALLASPDTLLAEFAAGRLGMLVGRASVLAAARGAAPAVALVPRPAAARGDHASYADALVLAGFRASRHKEPALRLARSLARPDGLGALAASLPGLQPATVLADSAPLPLRASAARVLARQCATARFAPAVAHWDSMSAAIGAELGEVLHGRKTAAAALADADARIDVLAGRR